MLTSDKLAEVLYEFLQLAFTGKGKVPAESKAEPFCVVKVKEMLRMSDSLTVEDVPNLSDKDRHALYVLISQHLMLVMLGSNNTTIPADFLAGCEEGTLGVYIVRLLSETQMPFPEQLQK